MRRDEIYKLYDVANKKAGMEVPAWYALTTGYKICIDSLFTPEVRQAIRYKGLYGGLSNETFKSIMKLPALYVDLCEIINNEFERLSKETKDG